MASVMTLAPPKQAPVSNVSILPIWKKLLELYQKKVGGDAFQELKPESMVLEDYCFAGPRKVGPWFGSLGEVKGNDACKIMVFGLEICADHAAFRIKTINSGPDPVAIDIQLVPSAGMRPTYFAARKGGYLFNCDGWSKPIPEGGKNLTVHFDGPSPCKKDGTPFTPGSPHTGLVKNDGAVFSKPGDCLVPAPHPVDAALAKVIFESGEGELHVYPVQDLPT
jgi:hypothetical protein